MSFMHAARVFQRAGFTLIEVLVTLILLSLLVAAVFPVVTQQLGTGDATRMANDLGSIRTGVESFNVNVRFGFPGDLEDLMNSPDGNDRGINNSSYPSLVGARWDGPYLDISPTAKDQATGNAFKTGFEGFVDYDLTCFHPASSASAGDAGTSCANGHYVAVQVQDIDTASFRKINALFDEEEADALNSRKDTGRMRCNVSAAGCSPAYYLAVPWRAH
jgi:prepilin-type N-terminal cleavage/methylation domain-containing protein